MGWRVLAASVAAVIVLAPTAVMAETSTATVRVGPMPVAVAVDELTNKAYVATLLTDRVTVIDGVTRRTTRVKVGKAPVALAVDVPTNEVYVADRDSNAVTVIDGATNRTRTIKVGKQPVALAVDARHQRVYVANFADDTVSVIDVRSGKVHAVHAGNNPRDLAVDPVTGRVYVAKHASNHVTVIDGKTKHTTQVDVGGRQTGIAVDPVTHKVYVSRPHRSTVVIDGRSNDVHDVRGRNTEAGSVAVNSHAGKAYLVGADRVMVVDVRTDRVVKVLRGPQPHGIDVDAKANLTYVATTEYDPVAATYVGTVMAIDGTTDKRTSIDVSETPLALAANPATRQVYVTDGDGSATIISPL